MISRIRGIVVPVAYLSLMTLACGGQVDAGESGGEQQEDLFGCISESRIAPFVQASARIDFSNGAMCSGTLVSPNQILTAAHCLCGTFQGSITFADNTGNVTSSARTWPILGAAVPPNAAMCADEWATLSENDPSFHQPFDVALLTIGPDAIGLPPITPSPMFLGDAGVGISTQSILNNAWSVGYGNNAPSPWIPKGDRCVGCSIRRSGPIGEIKYGADSCSYAGPVPLEEDCYNSPLWFSRSISEGNFTEPAQGDSGGGIFFNIGLGCTNSNQGTTASGLLGGVLSGWHSAEDTRARWASLGLSQKFICDGLNVPVARTVMQQRSDAVTAISTIDINDRARVLAEPTGFIGATISAGGKVTLGADALVGAVNANSDVWLRERAKVQGTVRATGNLTGQNGTSVGGNAEGTCTKFEPFSIAAPFAAGTQPKTFENIRGPALADYSITPSNNVLDLTVRARVRLNLSAGVYVFRNLDLEAGAIMKIANNTWIYLIGTGQQRIRGDIDAAANTIFWGVPNATSVLLGGEWRGALVAPKASVVGDMRDFAMLSGNFFVNRFTLHQGRWLYAVPFLGPWVPTCDANRTNCH